MSLVLLFRKLVFAQVLLGIIAFCIAEMSGPGGNPGMLLIAGTLGALSWYVVEGPSGRPLPNWAIHVGAFGAVGLLVMDLRWQDGDVVLAMGHFTMWLQIIQLYGYKTNREYGLLLVLSLLQMVGASILSVSMIFGVLLGAYCVLALFTVLLFQLKATSDTVMQQNQAAAPRSRRVGRPKAVAGPGHRWQFRLTAMGVGLWCGAIALAVFILLPRAPRAGGFGDGFGRATTGFSTQVRLSGAPRPGNRLPVLNLAVSLNGRDIGTSNRSWLLRGMALDHYDYQTFTWRRSSALDRRDLPLGLDGDGGRQFLELDPGTPVVDAAMTLRQRGHNVLFTPYPYSRVWSPNLQTIKHNEIDHQLSASGGTGALVYHVRSPLVRPRNFSNAERRFGMRRHYREMIEAGYARDHPPRSSSDRENQRVRAVRHQIAALTRRVLADAGLSRDEQRVHDSDDARIAATLAAYLRDNYSYSLTNPPVRHPEDPVVEFLFSRRQGHCELFASALAAMTRSIGMRARVISGFRAGEYNHVGGYYVVRQDDAHAWTEIDLGLAGWKTFDATPPGDVADEHAHDRGWYTPLRELYEHLEFTWLSSVVSYDRNRRNQVIEGFTDTVRDAADDEANWFGALVQWLKELPERWRLDRLGTTMVAVVCVFIAIGLGSLAHTLWSRRKRWATLQLTRLPRGARRAMSRRLGFYLYMLELLERRGHVRPPWQSPARFAQELVAQDEHTFAPVVELTEHFYAIRFGHREVDDPRKEAIREQLKTLEQNLSTTKAVAAPA